MDYKTASAFEDKFVVLRTRRRETFYCRVVSVQPAFVEIEDFTQDVQLRLPLKSVVSIRLDKVTMEVS